MKKALSPTPILIKKKIKPNDSCKKTLQAKTSYQICFLNLTDQPKSFCYCKQLLSEKGSSWVKKTFKDVDPQSIEKHVLEEENVFFDGTDCDKTEIECSGVPPHKKKNWTIIAEKYDTFILPLLPEVTITKIPKLHTSTEVKKIIKNNLGVGAPKKIIKNW